MKDWLLRMSSISLRSFLLSQESYAKWLATWIFHMAASRKKRASGMLGDADEITGSPKSKSHQHLLGNSHIIWPFSVLRQKAPGVPQMHHPCVQNDGGGKSSLQFQGSQSHTLHCKFTRQTSAVGIFARHQERFMI